VGVGNDVCEGLHVYVTLGVSTHSSAELRVHVSCIAHFGTLWSARGRAEVCCAGWLLCDVLLLVCCGPFWGRKLHVLSLTHYARLPQFPYQEHYDLVQEHLRLIAAASGADPNSTSALAGSKAASAMPVDEEWSEGEEEDGMAVDK
jgi:hypothetical protein